MARSRRRGFLRRCRPRVGAAFAGVATVGVLGAPASAHAALPGVPTFTVTPTTNLSSGQTVQVSWENQFVGLTETAFHVYECAGPFDLTTYERNCDRRAEVPATSGATVYVNVSQIVPLHPGGADHICKGTEPGNEQCYVVLVGNPSLVVKGSEAILFYTSSTK